MASVAFGLIMLILTLPLAITSGVYIGLNLSTVICGYLGLILTLLVFSALCNLMSLLTSRAIVAYLSGFLIIRLLMALKFEQMMGINFEQNYQNIITGRISISSVIYFVSIIAIVLWTAIAYLSSKKKD